MHQTKRTSWQWFLAFRTMIELWTKVSIELLHTRNLLPPNAIGAAWLFDFLDKCCKGAQIEEEQ